MKVFCAAALLCAATLSAQPYPAAAALDAAITEAVAQNKRNWRYVRVSQELSFRITAAAVWTHFQLRSMRFLQWSRK